MPESPLNQKRIEDIFRLPQLEKYTPPFPKKSSRFWSKKKGIVAGIILLMLVLLSASLIFYGHRSSAQEQLTYLKGPCPDFIGRKKVLHHLEREIVQSDTHFRQKLKMRQLWGKGGFGKSELAIEFANRFINDFSLIWTFYCDSVEHLERGYRNLAERLGILDTKDSLCKVKEKVHFYLEHQTFSRPWLLIYDNVEDEFKEYPQRGGVILVTSQKKVLNPELVIEVVPFTEAESIELLERVTGEKKSSAMQKLVADLEGIPLLINQAAHYIKSTPGCDAAEYHRIFMGHLAEKEGPLRQEMDVNQRYFKSLSASWQFPLKSLEKENPLALEWLYICAYLHAEQISEEWIDDWLAVRNAGEAGWKMKKEEILQALDNYGIIRFDQATKTFAFHRFFQHMIRESRKNFLQEDLNRMVSLLARHASDYQFSEFSSWKKGQLWYLHACQVRQWLEQEPILKAIALPAAALYEGMGKWNVYHEAYPAALENYNKALQLKITALDPNSPAIGKTLEHIAWALVELARYTEAISACQKAEKIQRGLANVGLLDLAKTLNTKGLAFHRQGRSEEGLKCLQEALKIRLDNLGVSSYDIGKNLHSITKAVNAKGREVAKLRKRSPASAAELLELIVDVASSFNNISRCYNGMSLLSEALAFSVSTIEIYAANCGPHHPLTIWAMQRKAYVLTCLEKHVEALKLYQETYSLILAIREKDHADFAYTLEGMGWCFFHLGNFKQAIRVFKEALRVGLQPLGEDAVGMIRAHDGIGWSYLKEGNIEEGLKYVIKHLQMCATVYPHTPKLEAEIVSFQKALNIVLASKNHREAIGRAAQVGCQISQEMLGQEHPVTQSLLNIAKITTAK